MFPNVIPMEAPFENSIPLEFNSPRAEKHVFPYDPSWFWQSRQNPPFLSHFHRFSALANLVPPLILVILTPSPPIWSFWPFLAILGYFDPPPLFHQKYGADRISG